MSKSFFIISLALLLAGISRAQEQGPFCGVVGTEGCTAVAANDPRIIGWATGCTVEFGPINIQNYPDSIVTFARTGDSALGPAWTDGVYHVVPLGDGGRATVTFDEPIHNVDGFDFAVYENSNDGLFLELAFVEVSSDGEHFVRFPATSLTQTETQVGTFGQLDATNLNNLAGKYKGGYGTPFDLNELRDSAGIDINNITHVRVVDVVGSIDPAYGTYDAYGHLVNDPYPTPFHSCGFDLDAVCVLGDPNAIREANSPIVELFPNPATDKVMVRLKKPVSVALFDCTGRQVAQPRMAEGVAEIEVSMLPNGIYFLRAGENCRKVVVRH